MTKIYWHTNLEPDRAGMALILSALKSNRRARHAEFELRAPTDEDPEGTISISGNRVDKLICPAEVRRLIEACLS
jgi:hypothetical protein